MIETYGSIERLLAFSGTSKELSNVAMAGFVIGMCCCIFILWG